MRPRELHAYHLSNMQTWPDLTCAQAQWQSKGASCQLYGSRHELLLLLLTECLSSLALRCCAHVVLTCWLPICCCVQEVEMGTGSVARDVVYQQLAKSKLEAGTQVRCTVKL